MQFQIKRDVLLKSLSIAHNIIERKNTLPILSNVLLEIKNNKLNIVATDLDLIFLDEISDFKADKEGSTTTSATVLYDILRKLPSNLDVLFTLQNENKLNISAENSKFNLLCLPVDNFPNFTESFKTNPVNLDRERLLTLLNKTKISMSNDETRHYLNGIFIHITESDKRSYLTGVATDSHRLSSSSIPLEKIQDFKSFILPKKAVFQLCNLLQESKEQVLPDVAHSGPRQDERLNNADEVAAHWASGVAPLSRRLPGRLVALPQLARAGLGLGAAGAGVSVLDTSSV